MKTKYCSGIPLVALTTLTVLGIVALLSWGKKGVGEKVGEKFDRGLDQAEDKIDDLLGTKGRFERVGERVDTLVDRARHTFKANDMG
jgi:hypothetical protein